MLQMRLQAALVAMVLLLTATAGCLGGDDDSSEEDGPIDLIVYYDLTNGTITESYNNGQQTSRDGAVFEFDFRETRSTEGAITTFSFMPGDGTDSVSIDASEESILSYTYQAHGIFEAELSAEDEGNNTASMEITIRVELKVRDVQSNTQTPDDASIDATPDDDSTAVPVQLVLSSTVENPTSVGFLADTVQVTWSLKNASGVEMKTNSETIGDGQSATWDHQQNSPESGTWTLEITVDAGGNNEEVNVDSTLELIHEGDESSPNPEPPSTG